MFNLNTSIMKIENFNKKETFEMYLIALHAVNDIRRTIRIDERIGVDIQEMNRDKKKLEVATRLLDILRECNEVTLVTD